MSSPARRQLAVDPEPAQTLWSGIFAVRCRLDGRIWVGSHPNLCAAKNSLWWFLRHEDNDNLELQEAWNRFGEAAFAFDILESFDPHTPAVGMVDRLRDRRTHWAHALQAQLL